MRPAQEGPGGFGTETLGIVAGSDEQGGRRVDAHAIDPEVKSTSSVT